MSVSAASSGVSDVFLKAPFPLPTDFLHNYGYTNGSLEVFSLSKGFHRYLSVSGLKQGEWLDGCVDMTLLRRPDGSGGPLVEGERIDDIQFYVDPRAELLIDDIVLFDAETLGGKRPFPKRLLYTGWFKVNTPDGPQRKRRLGATQRCTVGP